MTENAEHRRGRPHGRIAFALIALSAFSGACYRIVPRAQTPYTVMGIVTSIDATGFQLRHKSGQRVRIVLSADTRISRRGNPAAARDIEVGMRLMVIGDYANNTYVAHEVRLFRAARTTTPPNVWSAIREKG